MFDEVYVVLLITFSVVFNRSILYKSICVSMGVREGLCPNCQKKISRETFQNCCRQGGRSDYEKFLLDSIFPTKLTEFPTKLTEFVPFIFIISQYCPTVKRILPDWLCLPNKLGVAPPPRPVHPCVYHVDCVYTNGVHIILSQNCKTT